MMTNLQERALRRALKRGGDLALPGHAGATVEVDVTPHRTFVAVGIQVHRQESCRELDRFIGPAREVYPLAAELLDTLVPGGAA